MLSPRKRPKPADDRVVLAELAIARERHEIAHQRAYVIEAVRPLRVTRHLRLLPGVEIAVELLEDLRRLCFQPRNLLGDCGRAVARLRARAIPRAWPRSRPPAFRNRGSFAYKASSPAFAIVEAGEACALLEHWVIHTSPQRGGYERRDGEWLDRVADLRDRTYHPPRQRVLPFS